MVGWSAEHEHAEARHTNRRSHANVPRNLIRMSSFTVSTGFATYTGFRAAPQVRAAPVSAAAADWRRDARIFSGFEGFGSRARRMRRDRHRGR